MKHVLTVAAFAAACLATPAFAHDDQHSQPKPGDAPCHHNLAAPKQGTRGHDMHAMQADPKANASTQAFQKANAAMHANMDIIYTGDADVDFLRGMIAHHQGAVDMAQIVLDDGKNPQVRRLARDIIRAQNLEIKWMEAWLAQLDKNPNPNQPPLPEVGKVKPKWHDAAWDGSAWMGER